MVCMTAFLKKSVTFLGFLTIAYASQEEKVEVETESSTEVALLSDEPMALSEFYVCDSAIKGMNGRYVLSDDHSKGSPPLYLLEDPVDKSISNGLKEEEEEEETDFRLFRHGPIWMFSNFASWPPKTAYRCDPGKKPIDDMDFFETCGINKSLPPMSGFTMYDQVAPHDFLTLQEESCTDSLVSKSFEAISTITSDEL
jgi:hypothetical protein